jgi:hypothetical protein
MQPSLVRHPLRFFFSLAFALAVLPQATAQMNVRGNAILVGGHTVVKDPQGVGLAALSPGGKFIAYAHPSQNGVVVVRRDGAVVRTLPISKDLGINAVMKIGWLDENRVWIDGHRSPSSGALCIWSVDGQRLDVREGAMFTPSPDGAKIAQIEAMPGHRPASVTGPRVMIDRRVVYPLRGVPGDFNKFVWSPDSSRLAIIESLDARQQLVVISSSGRVRARTVIARDPVTDLRWSGSRKLVIHQDATSRTLLIR